MSCWSESCYTELDCTKCELGTTGVTVFWLQANFRSSWDKMDGVGLVGKTEARGSLSSKDITPCFVECG